MCLRRLMCAKVFCVPSRRVSRSYADRNSNRRIASSTGDFGSRTKPDTVPLVSEEGVSLSFSMDRGDSGKFTVICTDVYELYCSIKYLQLYVCYLVWRPKNAIVILNVLYFFHWVLLKANLSGKYDFHNTLIVPYQFNGYIKIFQNVFKFEF